MMSSESCIIGSDNMVAEYLLYRGFTQTFQSFESEKSRDKTKRFDISRIVEAIFHDLNNFEIENHVLFWDFLSKRFFFHLDAEHLSLCGVLKIDLLKYYLVNAYKTKNRDKITEFFSMYSHEILAESADYIPGNLRAWFALPYLEEPEKDAEFAVYFTQKWSEMLKITLHNFLSIILSTAPPPKLIILERWFRSDAQQETRAQLRKTTKQIECLISRLEKSEERIRDLRNIVKELVTHVFKISLSSGPGHGALFEDDDDEESRRQRARDLSQSVLKLSADCARKSLVLDSLSKEERLRVLVGKEAQGLFQDYSSPFLSGQDDAATLVGRRSGSSYSYSSGTTEGGGGTVGAEEIEAMGIEILESNLIKQLHQWLNCLAT